MARASKKTKKTMTTPHKPELTDELLSAYIDDAVTPDERQLVEQAAAADPEVAWRLESLQMTVQLLRELPALALPRSFVLAPEQVGEPVAEQMPAATVLAPRRVEPPAQPGFWARLGAAWGGFWQAGSPALRNAMAASFVLLFVFLAAPRFLTTPSGAEMQTGLVAPMVESARSDKLPAATAVVERRELPASDAAAAVEAPAPESASAAAAASPAVADAPAVVEASAPESAAAEADVAADAIAAAPLLAEPVPATANEAAAPPAAEGAVMAAAAAPAAMGAGAASDASPGEGSDPLALARAAAPLADDATVRSSDGDIATTALPAQAAAAAPAPAAPVAAALPPLATDTPPATPTSEPTAASTATATALPTATAHATPTAATAAVAANAMPPAAAPVAAAYAAPGMAAPAPGWLYLAQIAAGAGFLLFGLLWWRSRR